MANDEILNYGPELDDYTNNRLMAGVDDPDDPNQRAAARLRITVRPRPKEIPPLIEAPANVAGGIGNLLRNASNLSADDFRTARNKLFGMNGEERFMTFPERMVRGAVRTAQDAATGDFGIVYPDANGMVSDEAMGARQARDFQGVQDLSNVAIGGSMPMVAARGRAGGATLGSAPVPKEPITAKPLTIDDVPHSPDGLRIVKEGDQWWAKHSSGPGKIGPFKTEHEAVTNATEHVPGINKASPSVFYSGVENALEHSTLATATPEQWLGTLKNAKGVKPEEMQWLGLEDFLAEKKAKGEKVTRADLQEHIANNKIEVKEVHKKDEDAEHGYSDHDEDAAASYAYDTISNEFETNPQLRVKHGGDIQEYISDEGADHYSQLTRRWLEDNAEPIDAHGGDNAKFHDYQLPGGSDYGELLLTLPTKTGERMRPSKDNPGEIDVIGPNGTVRGSFLTKEEASQYMHENDQLSKNNYSSSHWDEPNVLAHVRYNTREIDGKKTLHLEEIQSDWHQEGRKKGYKQPIPAEEKPAAIEKLHELETKLNDMWSKRDTTEYSALKVETDTLRNRITGSEGVPDAPFKKSWPELAFKRMLRYAAENGYDAISWTPGEAQAARYDLSKHIKELRYTKNADGTYELGANNSPETWVEQNIGSKIPEGKLADYVGKDVAEKIVQDKGQNDPRDPNSKRGMGKVLSGVDLKVGGEGMKKFYDDQLAVIANKYGKAHGTKVEKKPIGSGLEISEFPKDSGHPHQFMVDDLNNPDFSVATFKTKPEAEAYVKEHSPDVHFMPLPKSLHETALQKGFPLFSHGLMLTPVDHDPFKDDASKRIKQSVESRREPGERGDLNKPVATGRPDHDRFGPPVVDPYLPEFERVNKKSIE